jgi:hypothetical protein
VTVVASLIGLFGVVDHVGGEPITAETWADEVAVGSTARARSLRPTAAV